MSNSGLTFTGERFLPECEREIWYEHYHRYAMALHWVQGKSVLDVACGEGYGSHLLASQAKTVMGVDVSASAVPHAKQTSQRDGLQFQSCDAFHLLLSDHTLDAVASCAPLDNLAAQAQ